MKNDTSSGESRSTQKPSPPSRKVKHKPLCGPVEDPVPAATCSVGDTVSSTEVKPICSAGSASSSSQQDAPCTAANSSFNGTGAAQGEAKSHTAQTDEIEVPGPRHLSEADGKGQTSIKDESSPAPNAGPFGEGTGFDFTGRAATTTDKRVLKNLDPVGARDRVLAVHRTRLRYVTDRQKLLVHDGYRYGDFPHIAEGLVLEVLDNVHREFVLEKDHVTEDGQEIKQDDVLKFQAKLRTRGMIQQVLALVCLDPGVQVKSSAFDSNPYEINLLNGLLNLETQELTPHDPAQLVTKLAPVNWIPDAPCPFWEALIDEITCRDRALAAYHQRLCGYCSTGSTQEEVMPILYGGGSNGKSRYLAALRDILGPGEYALTLGTGSILNSKYHGIRCDLRLLEGMRTVFAIEANKSSTLDQAVVKTIVAADEISARALRQNPVQFVPQAKIIMAVNHLPALVGNDHGMRRRIQVVPFRKRFNGSVKKEEIEGRIKAEKDGIFAWMVRGFQEWRKQGLNPPEVVLEATEEYFATNDHIGGYLNERTVESPEATAPVGDLHKDYEAWAHDCGLKPLGKHQFSDLLRARGLEQDRKNSTRFWKGVALKASPMIVQPSPFGAATDSSATKLTQ